MKYLKIPDIIKTISEKSDKMENGKLSVEELSQLLEYSRQLNERIAILRYKAVSGEKPSIISAPATENKTENKGITKEQILKEISTKPVVEEPKTESLAEGFSFNFSSQSVEEKKEENISQRSLLDQINEDKALSVNDKLAASKEESVAEKLQKSKIEDLRSVIGIGQKFLFMNDLFEGEKAHYDATIDKINQIHSKSEVEQFLDKDIAQKFNWDESSESVKSFRQLVERKF